MFDIVNESPISLSAAARAVPKIDGKQISPSTVWRWCREGIGGVRLQYAKLGRRMVTSKPALSRFAAAVAAADPELSKPEPTRKSSKPTRGEADRGKAMKAAESRLQKAGI